MADPQKRPFPRDFKTGSLDTSLIEGVNEVRTPGDGSNNLIFQDAANGNEEMMVFTEGGSISIKNRNMFMDENGITGIGFLSAGNDFFSFDTSGSGSGIFTIQDTANGFTKPLFVKEGGPVEFRNSVNGDSILRLNASGSSGSEFVNGEVTLTGGDLEFGTDTTLVHDRQDVSTDILTDGGGYYSVDSSGGARTLTLATADSVDGKEVNIKRNGANTVTVDTEGSDTIDDASSVDLNNDNDSVTLVYNSTSGDWETY